MLASLPLAAMTAYWASETIADAARWPDAGLVQAGLRLFEELPRTPRNDVLLATDLHAGNVDCEFDKSRDKTSRLTGARK
jgi:hypothetical protein